MSASQLSIYMLVLGLVLNLIANVNDRYVDAAALLVVILISLFLSSEGVCHKYVAMDHADTVTASQVTWNIVLIEYLLFI